MQLVDDLGDDMRQPSLNIQEMDDEVISALRGLSEDEQMEDGMDLSTVPKWLRESMKKRIRVEEVLPMDDTDT